MFKQLIQWIVAISIMASIASVYAQNHFTCSNDGQISVAQCENLVDFYHATNGDAWNANVQNTWLASENPCDWQGVICWGSNVARIELINVGLQGQLPSLARLPNLVYIALIGNPQLTGPLPDLSHLDGLADLFIFNNGLSGFLPDFSKHQQLNRVVMFNNDFIGPIPNTDHLSDVVLFGNDLCLSPQVTHNVWAARVNHYPLCTPMLSNRLNGQLYLQHFGVIPNDDQDDAGAMNHALSMLSLTLAPPTGLNQLHVHFPSGVLDMSQSIRLKHYHNITLSGGTAQRTILRKQANFANNQNTSINDHRLGSLINASYGEHLTIQQLTFEGLLHDLQQAFLWWDNGIYVGSAQHTQITHNRFAHFGDAATHIVTDKDDPATNINSAYTNISNNDFYNIMQTSTTSESGGTQHIRFAHNTITHLKGAIKFASRREGAEGIVIENNHIQSAGNGGISTNNGIEIEGYRDIVIQHNQLSHGQGVGIVIRSPQNAKMQGVWDWGNVDINNNHISNYRQGVYLSNLPHVVLGVTPYASHVRITNNQFDPMWNANHQAMLHIVGNQWADVVVSDNHFVGGIYTIWPGSAPWLTLASNTHTP